jgi:hypothetical protein
MSDPNNLESLQRLRCKLGNVLEVIYDSRREIRGELLFYYSNIYYAIIASIKVPNSAQLQNTNWKHVNRYRRNVIREERAEAREWIMSDVPEALWRELTAEDWVPVRELIQRLWHDLNTIMCAEPHPSLPTKLSREVRRQLQKSAGVR